MEDLTALSEIDEDIILQQLRVRFQEDRIYTLVGDILIAVNPYKELKTLTDEQKCRATPTTIAHVSTVASQAYYRLITAENDQCFVISGESGAGKTETCKYIIRYLTELSSGEHTLEQRIMQMNPLLEAFGNSKTLLNNNSSRFGKYLQLKFHKGKMVGAKVNEYLLEKSRVVSQGVREGSFHVFYWLLEGLDSTTADKLSLSNTGHFRYLSESSQESTDNVAMFQQLRECFDLVGFREDEQYSVLVCLAVVLHIGNIDITQTEEDFADVDRSSRPLLIVAELLGIDIESLVQLLTVTVSLARKETIQKHLSKPKAEASRDAVAKALYDRLFRWIVNQINRLLAPDIRYVCELNEIGILDIFGFENFRNNSFEQLCINIANERLHQFFTHHIFEQEVKEYAEEGIKGLEFSVSDNHHLLDTFLVGSGSVFSLLDEQHSIPGANDTTFLRKINSTLKKEPFYIAPKSASQGRFGIHHYAGQVYYSVYEFLDKNRDPLPSGTKSILQSSENQLVSLLFRATISSTGTLSMSRSTWNKISRRSVLRTPRTAKKSQSNTISSQFKSSLSSLVAKMSSSEPHFIRCIKPNNDKVPECFDEDCVRRQLLYTGVAETVRIRRDGFSYRPTFEEFNERFSVGAGHMDPEIRCQMALAESGILPDQYLVGTNKIFLRHHHLHVLEGCLQTKRHAVILIQAVTRGYMQRILYSKLLEERKLQQRAVEGLLREVARSSESSVDILQQLNDEDRRREIEEKRKSELLQLKKKVRPLPPPSDLYAIPPPPVIDSDDEEDNTAIELHEEHGLLNSLELIDPAQQAEQKKPSFQSRVLHSSISVSFSWLYGMLSQKKAESLLQNRPVGTFLVRIHRKRLSHILSYRTSQGFGHININQLPNMKYVLSGEVTAHTGIEELVVYHTQNAMTSSGDKLTQPFDEDGEHIQFTIAGSGHSLDI